jgi:hypothetical protein
MGTGSKKDVSSTGCIRAAGIHNVTARSRLARVLKLIAVCLFNFPIFFRAAVNRGYRRSGYGGTAAFSYCSLNCRKSTMIRF